MAFLSFTLNPVLKNIIRKWTDQDVVCLVKHGHIQWNTNNDFSMCSWWFSKISENEEFEIFKNNS